MQKSEDCLSSSLFIYQAYLFKESTKSIYLNTLVLCQHSPIKKKKRLYVKVPSTLLTQKYYRYTTNSSILNTVRNGQMRKGIMQQKKSDVMKMMTTMSFWSFEGKLACSTEKTWNFQISKSKNEWCVLFWFLGKSVYTMFLI